MRIVILTYESLYSNLMTERLLQEFPGQVVGIVRSDCLVYGKTLPCSICLSVPASGLWDAKPWSCFKAGRRPFSSV